MRRVSLAVLLFSVIFWGNVAQDEDPSEPVYAYTYHQPTGNRFVEGEGTFPDVEALEFALGGFPMWLVGLPVLEGDVEWAAWTLALADGSTQGTYLDDDGQLRMSLVTDFALPPEGVPVMVGNQTEVMLNGFSSDVMSSLTHPVFVGENALYIDRSGGVNIINTENDDFLIAFPVNALPDGRIAINSDQTQAALYFGATNERYVHAIMGDDLEGRALMVIDLADNTISRTVELEGDEVFESLMPIWADVDEDGTEDLITTVSAGGEGAQIRVYGANDGSLLASGPAIGSSNRWRHQLAWGAFGPNGENELVEVLTPHIGGVVGFYQYDGVDRLEIVARRSGFTSHVIGSRNLDMAVAGDFNGDGLPEIVLPSQDRTRIAGLQHTAGGEISEMWSLPVDGIIETNLSAVQFSDGTLGLAAGVIRRDGTGHLQVWLPRLIAK